jgi:hypothetical protein
LRLQLDIGLILLKLIGGKKTMGARQFGSSKKTPWRPILGIGISVIGIGVVTFVISVVAGWTANPTFQAISKGLRSPVPYVLLSGFGLLVIYAVLRSRPDAPARERNEPAFIGSEMTDFVSHLHRTPPEMEPLDSATSAPTKQD